MQPATGALTSALSEKSHSFSGFAFAWGHEEQQVIGLIAEHYMTPAALKPGATCWMA